MFKKIFSAPPKAQPETRDLSPPHEQVAEEKAKEPVQSPADELLAAIEVLRSTAAHAMHRAEDQHREDVRTAEQTIAAARDFMTKSGVGDAACRVYDATKPYDAWCKREDWPKWNVLGVTEVTGGDAERGKTIGFRYRDRKWEFTCTRQDNCGYFHSDQSYATLSVLCDENRVLELAIAQGFEEFDDWHAVDINALRVGSWVADLVEMDVLLDKHQKQRWATKDTQRMQEQASRIKL
jgi:hypothetical protein